MRYELLRTTAACLAAVVLVSGCSTISQTATDLKKSVVSLFGGSDDNRTAQELAWEGMEEYEDGDYRKAVENFQRLKDIYPFSKYAMLAELKLGDAHYRLEQYEDAVFAYEEFEKLHPRNEAIPYVIYQIGRCYFDRIDTTDRDQSAARKALDAFVRLRKQYPDDPHARSAADHILTCQKGLAGHEFGIGAFYYKTKHYKAALARFKTVVTSYPDLGYHQPALDFISRCERQLQEQKTPKGAGGDSLPADSYEMMPEG